MEPRIQHLHVFSSTPYIIHENGNNVVISNLVLSTHGLTLLF